MASQHRRIALVINGLTRAGAETQLVLLAERLRARGDDVILLVIHPPQVFEDRLERAGIPIIVVGGEKPRPLSTLAAMVSELRRFRPPVLISFLYQSNVLALLAGRIAGIPSVVSSIRNERLQPRYRELVFRMLRRLGSCEVVNSRNAARSLVGRGVLEPTRLRVIPNGVETSIFCFPDGERKRLRDELKLGAHDVFWVAAGRLVRQKNFLQLIDAFHLAHGRVPSMRLCIAGDGPEREQLEAAIASHALGDVVQVLGERSDLPALLNAADAVVLSSSWEGLPNIALEAMASGLPVVAPNVGGLSEVVTNENGRLVKPDATIDLSEALTDLSNMTHDARKAIGERGRRLVSEHYAVDVMFERWSALIDQMNRSKPSMDEDRRIALLLKDYGGGGAQRVMLTLASHLSKRGHAVDLVVVSPYGPLIDEVPQRMVDLIELDARRGVLALPALIRYLRRRRPAVLLSTIDNVSLLALLASFASKGTRFVHRASNTTSVRERHPINRTDRLVYRVAKHLLPRASVLIAPSRGAADDLSSWLGKRAQPVHVVPSPLVTEELRKGAAEPAGHEWFHPGEPPVILGVGRLLPHKGFACLIRAFARTKELGAARLLLLGEGPQRLELETLCHNLGLKVGSDGDVIFHGFDPNPFRFMSRCRVFVLPSELEGLPGVLVQAMACGASVVATDCPSGPREILGGGRWGTLVPVGDHDALAQAIRVAIVHPRTPPAEAWSQYTAEAAVDHYERVLGDL